MGLFKRKVTAADDDHPPPVEIDLGMRKVWEVQTVVAALEDEGCRLYLVSQKEIPELGDLTPMHCRVLVNPADADRVLAEFTELGWL